MGPSALTRQVVLGFRVSGFGFRVSVRGSGFGVQVSGLKVGGKDLGLRVLGWLG